MDATHQVEYKIRDLATRAVTLFPSQAQVTREIKDVPLKIGPNEVVIYGLSPTVDEQSIKVEGTGSATITDIAVEQLPNRELFDDIYPDSDLDRSDPEPSDDDDDSEEPAPTEEILAINRKIADLKDEKKRASEIVANADNRLRILDSYGKTLAEKEKIDISDSLETYKIERAKAFEDHMAGLLEERRASRRLEKANKEHARLVKKENKEKARANREKNKILRMKERAETKRRQREAEALKEKARVKQERYNFWPKYCYCVRIQLEVMTAFTPMSSRRASISSDVDMVERPRSPSKTMDCEESPHCDLVLSYITTSAFWSPSYDLQLSTTSSSATLCFDASLNNTTSETWENCKITLSTSQTNFSGIENSVPILTPWRLKLAGKGTPFSNPDILNSHAEELQRRDFKTKQRPANVAKSRGLMFGFDPQASQHALQDYQMQLMLLEQQNKKRVAMARNANMQPPQQVVFQPQAIQQQQMAQAAAQQQMAQQQMQMQQQQQQQMQSAQQAFGSAKPQSSSLFGSSNNSGQVPQAPPPPPAGGGLFGAFGAVPAAPVAPANSTTVLPSYDFSNTAPANETWLAGETATLLPEPESAVDFEESLVEETGFTTTYDLPGLKTLAPKSTASKQRVARISFTNVIFSHTVVAKYQPVAHLRAKLKNNSKLTLLRGPTSLTLDGSFMGRSTLPRCSAGDTFSMNLGIDPAIKILYPKAEVRRTTTGVFNKENSSVYIRTVTVQNSRASAGKPVKLLVLDQVPVSEDERLRVELINPRGLTLNGGGVASGVPGRESQNDRDWGTANAYLKKGGQITWEVNLNAGKAVKLGLEYSVMVPSGDFAIEC